MLSSINKFIIKMLIDVQNTIVKSADGGSKKLGEYSNEVILIAVSYTHLTLPTILLV